MIRSAGGRRGSVGPLSVRHAIALLLAASFALGSNVDTLRGRAAGRHRWEAIASDVERFVPIVAPDSAVGVLVQGIPGSAKEDEELVGVARYAFVPAHVRGIAWNVCASSGAGSCGLGDVRYLLVGARPRDELIAWGSQLGLSVAATGRHFALLARERP